METGPDDVCEVAGTPREVVALLDAWLAAHDDRPLVVPTSGSTGRPKRVMLSRSAVLASGAATAARLGAQGAWLLALPASYVAGAQVVCRSLVAGHAPVVLDDHASLADAARALPSGVPHLVSLVPTQLHRLLAEGGADLDALCGFHTVLLGGGPVDAALRARAADAGVRTVATYGMAETAGGCVYDGVPLDGVGLALAGDGRIRLGGPTLFSGYTDERLTAEVLVDGWFHTSDAGRLDHDGRLQVLGRLDDMVVTGGVNVPASVVATRLRTHPRIDDAVVLGVPDEEWGNRLVAFVVPSPGASVALAEVRRWVGEVHPRSWAPRELVVLPKIPLLANGKTDRLGLRGRVS
ncbi:AMP-binding protein [Nocardioides acrostichi]|uniref:AMP-binding protein n=1 Tax=Nocardioides acrostichi TaxID=2784339 RepID=A0A930Y7W9_9ACTN|nr:AMP-binding protein [Nocardioides acrostichi]MBF4163880.1 AMP-binding protein [Nocardioides acrostichi]